MQRRETGIAGLLGQLRPPEDAGQEPPAAAAPRLPRARGAAPKTRGRAPAAPAPASPAREPEEVRGAPGRPRVGKRSNPDYGLRGLWLRTETYLDVTDRLRRRREYADASELVQVLLEQWLATR